MSSLPLLPTLLFVGGNEEGLQPVDDSQAYVASVNQPAGDDPGWAWDQRAVPIGADRRCLDLAVQDLVGDGLEGGANRARRNPLKGRPGGVDLGLGGAAGLGEGG